MPGRIPRPFIDDLLSRVDIVDVIDEYVPLVRAGRDFKACCPFHTEKTPSFTVSRTKQFYHCFGCQANGTAISFLMEYARLDFIEAIEELAHRVGVEVPKTGGDSPARPSSEPIFGILERASRFYRRQLRQHPQAARAVDYLRSRGVSGEVAAAFHIGFAPPGWDNLVSGLARESTSALMVQAGLAARRDDGGRLYDRFRDRIVFPILDRRSRPIGFGGRSIGDDTPKYLNTPETPVFHKGRELYGLPQARAAGGTRVVVVEGYMDVVALAQHGVGNAAATLGTAVTPEHLKQLFRIWPDVVFCFDGDEAGARAAWRALETTLPLLRDGRQAFFMFLPEGEDPDSLVRARGRKHFEKCIDEAATLGTFLFEKLESQVNLETLDGRARLFETALPLLDKIPTGAFRELASRSLEQRTGLRAGGGPSSPGGLRATSARHRGPSFPGGTGRAKRSTVRTAITLLVRHPWLASATGPTEALRDIDLPGTALLAELIELAVDRPYLSTGVLLEHYRENEKVGRQLARLAAEPLDLEEEPPNREVAPEQEPEQELKGMLEQQFRDCLRRIEEQSRKQAEDERFRELVAKTRVGRLSEDELREFARLTGGAPK